MTGLVSLDDVATFPTRRSLEFQVLAWMWFIAVLVFACVGVRVFHLIEVAKCMVRLACNEESV